MVTIKSLVPISTGRWVAGNTGTTFQVVGGTFPSYMAQLVDGSTATLTCGCAAPTPTPTSTVTSTPTPTVSSEFYYYYSYDFYYSGCTNIGSSTARSKTEAVLDKFYYFAPNPIHSLKITGIAAPTNNEDITDTLDGAPRNNCVPDPTPTPTATITATPTPTASPILTYKFLIVNNTTNRTVTSAKYSFSGPNITLDLGSYPIVGGQQGGVFTHPSVSGGIPNAVLYTFGGSGEYDLIVTQNGTVIRNFVNSTEANLALGGTSINANDNIVLTISDSIPVTPTPTETVTPTPTETPTMTPTNTVTPTVTPTETIAPTATPTNTVTPTASPCATGATFVTITNTMWLYPQADIDYVLANTSVPVTFVANKFYFNNRADMKTFYDELYVRTEVTQPVGNEGYSLGVGTVLLDLTNELMFVLIDTNEIVVFWRLVRQLTDQSTLDPGGNSPIETIGYITVEESWPTNDRPAYYDPAYVTNGDNICIPPVSVNGALLIENGNFLVGENGNNLLFDNNPPTPTPTNTPTHTLTPTPTGTPAPSVTPTNTPTSSQVVAVTPSPTHTPTHTPTPTTPVPTYPYLISFAQSSSIAACNAAKTITVYAFENTYSDGILLYDSNTLSYNMFVGNDMWYGYGNIAFQVDANGYTYNSVNCPVPSPTPSPTHTVTPTHTPTPTVTPTASPKVPVTVGNWYFGYSEGPYTVDTVSPDGGVLWTHGTGPSLEYTYNPNLNGGLFTALRFNTKDNTGADHIALFQAIKDYGGTMSITQNGDTAKFVCPPNLIYINDYTTYKQFTLDFSVTQIQNSTNPFVYGDPITITFEIN